MRRFLPLLLPCVGLLLLAESAQAQPPYAPYNPYAPPAFSPYLNLLRRGANPAINYYGLVRPELEWRGRMGQMQSEINTIAPYAVGADGAAGLPFTGHPTQFLNSTHYFPGSRLSSFAAARRGPGLQQQPARGGQQQQQQPQQQQQRTTGAPRR